MQKHRGGAKNSKLRLSIMKMIRLRAAAPAIPSSNNPNLTISQFIHIQAGRPYNSLTIPLPITRPDSTT